MCNPTHWNEESSVSIIIYKHGTPEKGGYYYEVSTIEKAQYVDWTALDTFLSSLAFIGSSILTEDYPAETHYRLTFPCKWEGVNLSEIIITDVGIYDEDKDDLTKI